MSSIGFRQEEEPEYLPHIIDRITNSDIEYDGVDLRFAIVRSDLLDKTALNRYTAEDDYAERLFEGEEYAWFNFLAKAVLKYSGDSHSDQVVGRDAFKIYHAYIDVDRFTDILAEINETSRFEWDGRSIRVEKDRDDDLPIDAEFRASDYTRYDHYGKQFSAYSYHISGQRIEKLSRDGVEIDYSNIPSPFKLEDENPPLLNLPDAIDEYLNWDASRTSQLGDFYIYQPYYPCRIFACDIDADRQRIRVELDSLNDAPNNMEELGLKLVSPVGVRPKLRESPSIDSQIVTVEIDTLPESVYVLLKHHEKVVDMRRVSSSVHASPFFDKAQELTSSNPFLAGAAARMALLAELREKCAANAISYDEEDDDIPDLARELMEQGIISNYIRGRIQNEWYNVLSDAAHFREDKLDEESIRQTITDLGRWLEEGDI